MDLVVKVILQNDTYSNKTEISNYNLTSRNINQKVVDKNRGCKADIEKQIFQSLH